MDVGFIGLGRMGLPMAGHIQKHATGGRLILLDRFPDRLADLVSGGAELAANPREVAADSDLIILMVPAIGDIEALLDGPDGLLAGLRKPLILVVSSTTSAKDVRDLQARLDDQPHPVTVVDAPVSGGVEGAEAGALSIMIGGPDEAAATAVAVMSATGTAVHLGPLGAGQVAKACNQLIVAAEVVAVAEASLLAERAGLDVGRLFDLLSTGYAGSRIMEVKGPKFVNHDHTAAGPAKFLIKDLKAVIEEADVSGLRLVTAEPLLAAYTALTEAGLGDEDASVVQQWIEDASASETANG
ncbi:MAG: NAD(P)-dependent oxidoreductase [Micropruina sp.]|uniref:NAD(P)-dependent oxidoreductase n=1 Tax=Micropruina sp. TaxID=2737536 RepID=UPI0039E2C897